VSALFILRACSLSFEAVKSTSWQAPAEQLSKKVVVFFTKYRRQK
jgi:hypothetical protein